MLSGSPYLGAMVVGQDAEGIVLPFEKLGIGNRYVDGIFGVQVANVVNL